MIVYETLFSTRDQMIYRSKKTIGACTVFNNKQTCTTQQATRGPEWNDKCKTI